jgi:SHAQKYF class myb-like DNA-binding protein
MENMEKEPNNNYLLYYTKYHPYMGGNNNYNIENESPELNEDENDNNNNIINGRWSQKEHLLFIKGCLLYNNNWKMVQNYIQTRSCSQIRSHSQKYFYKLNKKYQNNNVAKILNQEEINKLINKNKFSNKDMESAEMHILTLFNGNKDRTKDKDLIEDSDENNFNIKKKAKKKSMKSQTTKEKEKIFDITKIPKEEKFKKEEMVEEKTDSNNNDSEKENELFHKFIIEQFNKFDNLNFFIERTVEYQKDGRYQTKEEAIKLDEIIRNVLIDNEIYYASVNVDDAVKKIVDVTLNKMEKK